MVMVCVYSETKCVVVNRENPASMFIVTELDRLENVEIILKFLSLKKKIFYPQSFLATLIVKKSKLKAQCVKFTGIYWHKTEIKIQMCVF